MNTIYLVRHGENPANLTKEFSCRRVDYPLTAKGRLQAAQTAEHFSRHPVNEIWSSPLKRAVETAESVAAALGLPVQILEDFREVDVGDLEGRPPDAASWAIYGQVMQRWLSGQPEFAFPGGESRLSLTARFIRGLDQITAGKAQRQILVVGHGGIFTNGVADLCRVADQRAFFSIENHNCSISELRLSTKADRWADGSGVELIRWGDTGHLSGLAAQFVESVPAGAKVRDL